ncbi:MAG: bifunctional glutamate N-acetyltransferase/amino-acid acetyltransferase ArgJ [Myxococcota bacterium]
MAYRVAGFRAAGVSCGIKPSGALDLALIVSDRPANAAAVFTRNRFPGAPVQVSRRYLRDGRARAVVVNSGISNVATGEQGLRNAREMCRATADALGLRASDVQVASTGVIGSQLPIQRIARAIPRAARELSASGWSRAARAILTTDIRPKLVQVTRRGFSLLGLAKGAGMIMPNMATMLAYIVTDLAVERAFLKTALREAVDPTLNRLTIDGETSTSDTVLLMANGAAGNRPLGPRSARAREFRRALAELASGLTEKLALDGEGVTRIARIDVRGAKSDRSADRVARKVGNSLLVKTALFGADPNWGRIVQAVGAAGVAFSPRQLGIRIGGAELLCRGTEVESAQARRRAERAMRRKRVEIDISLGAGPGRASILTTDLGHGYIRINSEYTT